MRIGLTFFPVFDPSERPAADYYADALTLTEHADRLGLDHVQIVEHHGSGYGGYSPDPLLFLAAAAARTEHITLTSGAVVPAFDHPFRLAGALAMLDALTGGRLEVGVGRAFLPSEFRAFGVPIDDSRERFERNLEVVRRLWTETDVVSDLPWAPFGPVTLQPRPLQQPHPPILVAATSDPAACARAGRAGFGLQLVPTVASAERLGTMIDAYRDARASAGHPGRGRIQLKFACYLDEDESAAHESAESNERRYLALMAAAVAELAHTPSAAYPGYEALAEKIERYDLGQAIAADRVLVGTPEHVSHQLARIGDRYGHDLVVSLHLNPGLVPLERALRSLELVATRIATIAHATSAPAR